MPLITVLNYTITDDAEALATALREACLGVSALWLKEPHQVTVVLGGHRILDGPRELTIIKVDGLFDRPERTFDVRMELAVELFTAAKRVLGPERPIEVIINRFNPITDVCISST